MGELPRGRSDDVTIVDMEASLEHLSRGTVQNVDVLLVITEPYFRSLETTGRIVPLARELGLQQVFVIGNKTRTPADEDALRAFCARRDYQMIGIIPFDAAVTDADARGQALIDVAPGTSAVKAIEELASRLLSGALAATGTPGGT
jgi:CO dehydrogenase maturation factor